MNIGTRLIKVAAGGMLLGLIALNGSAAGPAFVPVLHNTPSAVITASYLGRHDPQDRLSISVSLSLRNQDQLATFMQQLHDPSSPNFHRFLQGSEFTALYGPTQAQVDALKQYLSAQGVEVTGVDANRLLVHGVAASATLERTFGVKIGDYSFNGQRFYSPASDPQVPAALGSSIVAVMGLDNAVQLHSHLVMAPDSATPDVKTVNVTPKLPAGYSPQQIATYYNWPSLTDTSQASGVTIAIATAYAFRTADITKFWSTYGLPAHTVDVVSVDGVTRRLNDETTLDVEHSSAMAPGAKIVVYEGVSAADSVFDDVFNQIVSDAGSDPTLRIVTTSWGQCEYAVNPNLCSPPASTAAEVQSFINGVAIGMTFVAAAGDDGSRDRVFYGPKDTDPCLDCADYPSIDPNVVAAGGTRLVLSGAGNSETAWGSTNLSQGGAGGADSVLFAEPHFQKVMINGVPVPITNPTGSGLTHNTSCISPSGITPVMPGHVGCTAVSNASRQNSDLSMDADPATSYSFYYNGVWGRAGGTSFVAPQLAGLFAILHNRIGGDLGAVNNEIYCEVQHHSYANYAADFNDITLGNNGPTFTANARWDHPTGWGSPNAKNLLTNLVADVASCAP